MALTRKREREEWKVKCVGGRVSFDLRADIRSDWGVRAQPKCRQKGSIHGSRAKQLRGCCHLADSSSEKAAVMDFLHPEYRWRRASCSWLSPIKNTPFPRVFRSGILWLPPASFQLVQLRGRATLEKLELLDACSIPEMYAYLRIDLRTWICAYPRHLCANQRRHDANRSS
jgi:hypothetical protein